MLCALVLTYNEEIILGECLDALDFVDEILVYDSYSQDKTLQIAKEKGARIIQRVFDNYADQRNEALAAINSKFEWILMVDADEIVTPELRNEILALLKREPEDDLYRIRRKDHFNGKWLRYSSGYPTWFPRLFKNRKVKVARAINEEYLTDGTIGILKGHLLHFPFNKGLDWWLSKHEKYARMEAEMMRTEKKQKVRFEEIFSNDPVVRRKAQKLLSFKIPFRPYFVFIAFYVFKKGFLDGQAGLEFCLLRLRYEKMIANYYKQN